MNKNKKVFKFQRKNMVISNPINQEKPIYQPNDPAKVQKDPNHSISQFAVLQPNLSQKLQIPKQMKFQSIGSRLRSKFIAMMQAEPLFPVDSLFENEVVAKITGNVPKNNRQSFSKKNQQKEKQVDNNFEELICEETQISYFDGGLGERNKGQKYSKESLFLKEKNYLQMISQGIPAEHIPLQKAFEAEMWEKNNGDHQERRRKTNMMRNQRIV